MIKQRFYTDGQYVMQDGEVYVICSGKHNADVVATALNELLDKNEELKEERDYFERKKCEYHNKWNLALLDNINLRKENEQLQKENKGIQNKVFRLLNHLCDVEDCITREQVKEWWNNEIGDSE